MSEAALHPTAQIHPDAVLGPGVTVGPYAIIDAHVTLGADCRVGPYVYLTGWTEIGAQNCFHAGCVIGDAPQDLKYKDEPTGLRLGDRNIFREHVTVHRSNKEGEPTVVGSDNYLMADSHVGHNSRVGSHVVVANGVLLGGHVEVGDRAFLSGNCAMHQFVRVGALAIVQGGGRISKDVPPYCVATGLNSLCGLNVIGLRRAGWTADRRLELKKLYRALLREGGSLSQKVENARAQFQSGESRNFLDFIHSTKRGICSARARVRESDNSLM